MRVTHCKRAYEITWNFSNFPSHGSRFGCVYHITQFARNVGLLLTIFLKYSFSWVPFPRSLIFKNLNMCSSLVREFKFAKLDMFFKIKPDSGSICKYEKLNYDTLVKYIWQCMMGTMNLIFMIGFQMRKIKDKI